MNREYTPPQLHTLPAAASLPHRHRVSQVCPLPTVKESKGKSTDYVFSILSIIISTGRGEMKCRQIKKIGKGGHYKLPLLEKIIVLRNYIIFIVHRESVPSYPTYSYRKERSISVGMPKGGKLVFFFLFSWEYSFFEHIPVLQGLTNF